MSSYSPADGWEVNVVKNMAMFFAVLLVVLVAGCSRKSGPSPSVPLPAAQQVKRDLHLGRGVWVVDVDKKPLTRTYAASLGLNYIIVKAFDGDRPWNVRYLESLQAEHSDCKLFLYGRFRGKDPEAEIELAKKAIDLVGSEGFVFDIEGEYNNSSAKLEHVLSAVKSYRDKHFSRKLLAFSTYGLRDKHRALDYSLMEKYCDIAMPQCYFVSRYLPKAMCYPWPYMQEAWRQWQDCPIPIVPTCQVYDGAVSAQEIADFTALGDKGFGVNYFKWELAGDRQINAMVGNVKTKLTPAQIEAVQNPKPKATRKSHKAKGKSAKQAKKPAKEFELPAMPLAPTKKGSLSGLVVIIDPGHGGGDPGKPWPVGKSLFTEAGITYQAAWQLSDIVRQKGAWVYLTAYSPTMLVAPGNAQTPPARPNDAVYMLDGNGVRGGINKPRADYTARVFKKFEREGRRHGWHQIAFVSVHVDAQKAGITGAHTLWWDHSFLAEAIAAELKKAKIVWNAEGDARHQNVTVLRENPLDLKYEVLVEMGVPANSKRDSWRLRSPKHRRKILLAITAGLEKITEP